MNFFRRNISGGGGGHSNNAGGTSGGGSADNILSTPSKHQDFYIQNKFGSNSFSQNTMNVSSDFTPTSFDQKDNLARNCREFYERRVRMAEIASQRWGDKGNKTTLVQQGQTSPNSLTGEETMIIGTSDVTSSISSSSRDDSTSSYKESSANSSDHESSSHPVLPILPSLSSSIMVNDKMKNTGDAGIDADIFVEKPFLKCATLPNRKSSSTKTNDMRTSTMLKKRKGSSSAGSIVTDEEDEEIVNVHHSSSGSESCSDKLMSTGGCDEHSSSGLGSSVAGGRTSSSSGRTSVSGGLFDPETLPAKIADLRRDLLSLITLDNELFKNLLTINDTIEEMREQKIASTNNLQVLGNGNIENPLRGGNFILNGGRQHKRSKSSGKVSKSHSSSKFYENSTDESVVGVNEGGRSRFFEVYENQQRSLTILNDEDEDDEEEDQDKFNGNGFLSIGSDYFSSKGIASPTDFQEDSSEPFDLRYHHTFASLPADQSHFTTSNRNTKISSAGRRTSSSSNEKRVHGSGNNSGNNNNSSITTFDGLAKFMLRSRSFLLRPSRSSSKAISMPPSFSSGTTTNGGGHMSSLNEKQNGETNEGSGSTLFNRRRISFPMNSNNGGGNGTSIGKEENNTTKPFSNSGSSKIPIKIGSRSRSRSRDGTASLISNKHGPQSLPFHILQTSPYQADDDSQLQKASVIDEVELDDTLNNYNTTNNVRHISTMPRQSTQKRSGGSKGRKISQPNSNSKTTEPSKISSRFNSSSQINRKSSSSNQSYSNAAGSTKGRNNSQGSSQNYPSKYSSLTLDREKPSSGSLNHRTTSYQRPLFHLPHQTRSKHLWQKVFVQSSPGDDRNVENEGSSFSITPPGPSDGPDGTNDNAESSAATITTKHVKQNSFDSGIADAAHSFSSARGLNNVISD